MKILIKQIDVCLSDLEYKEFMDNYNIDTMKWELEQERYVYQAPFDYFSLTAYDLW